MTCLGRRRLILMDLQNKLNEILRMASIEAYNLKSEYVSTEHILLAISKNDSLAKKTLLESGGNYEAILKTVIENSGEGISEKPPEGYDNLVHELIASVKTELQNNDFKDVYSTVLLKILEQKDSYAVKILVGSGTNIKKLKLNLIHNINNINKISQNESPISDNLKSFATDLNERAKEGRIDPVIGREKEIERVFQVLSRRTKNNPILIGEAGVGKTAIAEGLAIAINEGNAPEILKNKIILSLDLARMVAGSRYRGDFEERIKNVIDEVTGRNDIILFIDEFHNVIGAGKSEGSLDAANILKPALTKGDLQIIGATTIDEYRKNIEKDPAFERRLMPILVEEPSVDATIEIINGIKDRYENHHKVEITDEAIKTAVELSDRYLTERFLPDKAIDVIDEAASKMRIKDTSYEEITLLKEELEKINEKKDEAVYGGKFLEASILRDEINTLKEKLDYLEKQKNEKESKNAYVLGYDEIAAVISEMSKIPVSKLKQDESKKYINLNKDLKKEIIGQDVAVDVVANAIKRARVGLSNPKKPIGNFMFLGPTGVGKTFLAKKIAEKLFSGEDDLIRIDMSEYMEKHSVSKLIGSPPGYVGYGEGGQLTEAVRKKPYSVILFDEVEKAHPDVFNMLLQVLDDGFLTDSQGKKVNFKNTVIILTSNIGASKIDKKHTLGFSTNKNEVEDEYERIKSIVDEELKQNFKPEFLNRLDEIVIFNSLGEKEIQKISQLLLDELSDRLKKNDINVSFTNKVVKYVSKNGFDKKYGARPIERFIKKKIENLLTDEILSGNIKEKELIEIDVVRDKIKIIKNSEKELEKVN